MYSLSDKHKNTPLQPERDWTGLPSQTGSGWVGERLAGPLCFCSCSKLRPAAPLGSFRSSCHFRRRLSSLTNQLSDLLQMLHSHVQVRNLFFFFHFKHPSRIVSVINCKLSGFARFTELWVWDVQLSPSLPASLVRYPPANLFYSAVSLATPPVFRRASSMSSTNHLLTLFSKLEPDYY